MFSLDKLTNTKLINQLEKYDIIRYKTDYIKENIFMVFDLEKDNESNTLLLNLWHIKGGFDHAFVNSIETEFSLNNKIPIYTPIVHEVQITKIINFRKLKSGLTQKEEFYFDVWPDETSFEKTELFQIPFEIQTKINNQNQNLILPSWTPLQQLPLDRVTIGSKIEVWQIDQIYTIMKVNKL